MTLEILRLDGPTFDAAIPDLAMLLADAVAGGASVGFTLPFSPDDAATWWQSIERDVVRGNVLVIVARLERRVVGSARRRGIATALMREIERVALAERRTLLVLDTIAGSEAEQLYLKLGWTRAAEIPDYAALPAGELRPTTIFYRRLTT